MATDDPELWAKWIQGAKAFERVYASGERCPANAGRGARCKCAAPSLSICKIWVRLAEIGERIGGATAEIVKGMD